MRRSYCLVVICLPALSIVAAVFLLTSTSDNDLSLKYSISAANQSFQSNYQSFRQTNGAQSVDCPVVLVVPRQESGTLVTWISLNALLSSYKLGSCSPKAVYLFTHPSLVNHLQHAVGTWHLPHSTSVHTLEFSGFPRGEGPSIFSGQGFLLLYQSTNPVPDLQTADNWMNEDSVRRFQEIENFGKDGLSAFNKSRTALSAVPSSVRFLARSCLANFTTPDEIIDCVEDSLHEDRHKHQPSVTWVPPRADPSWWKDMLQTAMEKHPQCRLSRPLTPIGTKNRTGCFWMDAHTNLRQTVLPFALGFQSAVGTLGSVSLSTQMTPDRLDRLEAIVQSWAGPVSVAFYAKLDDAMALSSAIAASDVIRRRPNVVFHIVGHCGPLYPVNRLRNIANRFAVTPYVLVDDVDFVPSPDTYPKLELQISRLDPNLKEVLVIPAVESFLHPTNITQPLSKDELRPLVLNGSVVFFQEMSFPSGHEATDLWRFVSSSDDYYVEYSFLYEPYIVTNRLTAPPFDERYIGWGYDKLSLLATLHVLGYRFKVASDSGFLFHSDHPTNGTWGRNQPEYRCNRGLFKLTFSRTSAWYSSSSLPQKHRKTTVGHSSSSQSQEPRKATVRPLSSSQSQEPRKTTEGHSSSSQSQEPRKATVRPLSSSQSQEPRKTTEGHSSSSQSQQHRNIIPGDGISAGAAIAHSRS